MKTILTVKGLDGVQKRECPKCPDSVMTFHPGGENVNFDRGDVRYSHTPDCWHCENCQLIIDAQEEAEFELAFANALDREKLQAKELWLIDLITREGVRDGLSTMAEHPRYRELVKLQGLLYPVMGLSNQIVFHDPNITHSQEER